MSEERPATGDDGIDFDRAWLELLSSLTADPAPAANAPAPPDPYDVTVATAPTVEDEDQDAGDEDDLEPADDEHFEPPPAPPLPTLRPVTLMAIAAMVAGILILAFRVEGGDFAWLGVAGIIGGAVSLVWNMRNGPPTDSGWDDGAVL